MEEQDTQSEIYVLSLEFIFLGYFCCFSCTFKIFSGKRSSFFFTLPIVNNSLAQHQASLVQGSYLSLDVYGSLLSVSATML